MSEYLLSVSPFIGFLSLSVLLALCFILVHVARLARLGRRYQKQQHQTSTPQETPQAEKQSSTEKKSEEPVYYIVERKRRVKSSFTEPKQIRFK